jgi:pimeloyl-ACP methyl ester carboxylesterase
MDRDNQTIKLKDGRTLGFSEHGDFNGKPVFFMHGNPGSRFMRYPDDKAKNLGLRIITPDRPGMGLSDFKPHRKPMDLPDDMVQLADHLQIGTFSIFGVSAGGVYTLACARKIPERLEKVIVLSGAAPIDSLSDPYQGMSEKFKKLFVMSSKFPFWLWRLLIWFLKRKIAKKPEAAYQDNVDMFNEFDKKIMLDPAMKAWGIGHIGEPYRQETKGVAHEGKILVSPWDFNPAEIKKHVDLWYWEDDNLVPIQWGKYLASVIPNNTTHFFPGGGHMATFGVWGDILKSIAGK